MAASGDKLFLSHTSVDKPQVEALGVALDALGYPVWLDAKELGAGQSIGKGVAEGIASSRALVVCVSAAAIESGWVQSELALAKEKKVPVFPVELEAVAWPDDALILLDGVLRIRLDKLGAEGVAEAIVAEMHRRGSRVQGILRTNTFPIPNYTNPATLLNARYKMVPFYEPLRETELALLEDWWASNETTSVRLFTGPGGTGKTRLFIEWTERLRNRHKAAGFLGADASDDDLNAVLTTLDDAFVVIDYAETRYEQLTKLLKAAAQRSAGARLRIALVARESGDWWPSLQKADSGIKTLLAKHKPHRLEAVAVQFDRRRQVFQHAMSTFAPALGRPEPEVGQLSFEDSRFERPLYLHLAALAAVEGRALAPSDLLEDAVNHEVRFWLSWGRGLRAFQWQAMRLVAALTLRGQTPRAALKSLDAQVKGPNQEDFRYLIADLYPSTTKPKDGGAPLVGGLEPDLLGEAIIKATLTEPETAKDYLEQVFRDVEYPIIENGFVVLGRLSLWAPEQTTRWIERFLDIDTLQRVLPAFSAALALSESTAEAPLGMLLAEALRKTEGAEQLAPLIDPRVPHSTVALREVAAWATASFGRLPPSDETNDEKTLAERGRLQNNLGARLSALGRREDALVATQEAVDTYRTLAKARPDAFLPDLAGSLNNLGAMLSALGRREEALVATQEAVDTYRTLAKARPDAFLPDLAGSLNNLGAVLSALGRREDALVATQEAVDTYRTLAKARPDAFLPDLAMSLNNLGSHLSALGRREDALVATQEAVDTRRTLAKARPDAFLPGLAMSLNNLGNRLSALGRREDALVATQEAVDTYRTLAKARPDAFLPDLTGSLNSLGAMLGALGRREDALVATQEAADIRRTLAKVRPDAFLVDLAQSLNNLGSHLSELGRREEALVATQEAVDTYRTLAKARPDAFLPALASSLNNLGGDLSALGRREEALVATQEAVDTRRILTKARPDAFLPDLAMSLNNLGAMLSELGRREEALVATQEAVDAYRALTRARPDAFLPSLAGSLNNLSVALNALGNQDQALETAQEAVQAYTLLSRAHPAAFRQRLLVSVRNYRERLGENGFDIGSDPSLLDALSVVEEGRTTGMSVE